MLLTLDVLRHLLVGIQSNIAGRAVIVSARSTEVGEAADLLGVFLAYIMLLRQLGRVEGHVAHLTVNL